MGDVNALDHAGFWRIADITLQAAFTGKTLDDVARDPERFRHLGYWSDGRRVIPPIVGTDLDAIPRVIPGNGLKIFPFSGPKKVALGPSRSPVKATSPRVASCRTPRVGQGGAIGGEVGIGEDGGPRMARLAGSPRLAIDAIPHPGRNVRLGDASASFRSRTWPIR